ncbi:hypothetical protein M427DRAFT_67590 [Gonapodya prolifera JEL478]|uniref:Fatty acyl-CoA reductase n=1 Tax=Gonapodya prolifera (strain JEL478) TaxID=1344416 RepID=A0A139AQK0_GONPJ|nr:hypothetical protein M427DRAFT_67590 [Gonapodya prolifera JEL478]|eukprot:KXS19037.1 hypothetical protein M427DRAFT_67590 [Gonapodya prolifera JEL478]
MEPRHAADSGPSFPDAIHALPNTIAPAAEPALEPLVEATDVELQDITVYEALADSQILVTGAAGFVGTALLHRLLRDAKFQVKTVVALVRAKSKVDALQRIPKTLHHFADSVDAKAAPKLVVLSGDSSLPNFGLAGQDLALLRKTDVVIHAAGNTQFTLSLAQAFELMVPLAFFGAQFSLLTPNVKTHIHISTTFIGWYLSDGSVVSETLCPTAATSSPQLGKHVNSYFESKTYAESTVNTLFTAQAGRKPHGKTARIVRLATLGPAAEFPRPGWGSGHPASPICAALAAEQVEQKLLMPHAALDVVPVDIAVNQILALTASAYAMHRLPATHHLHPLSPTCPTNKHLAEVPCYHVANGRNPQCMITLRKLNSAEFKILKPYVPGSSARKVYEPFFDKCVWFDVIKTRAVLGLGMEGQVQVQEVETSTLKGRASANASASAKGEAALADLPMRADDTLKLDALKVVRDNWKEEGWGGYLKLVRDEMEKLGPRADWEDFVN